jgi:acyl-CoA-binding protein
LNFNDDIKPIINLTETYKDPLISDLLKLYSPYKQGFYNVDSKRQKIVGRGQA